MLTDKKQILKHCAIFFTLISLSGCAGQKTYTYSPQSLEINLSQPLDGTSDDYLNTAATLEESPRKENYMLSAAVKLIEENALERAEQVVDEVPDGRLPEALSNHKNLIKAHLNLMKGRNSQALAELSRVNPNYLPEHYRVQFHRLLAHVYENKHNVLQAVEQRIKLEQLLQDEKERAQNKEKLWHALLQINSAELKMMQMESQANTELGGWIALAIIAHSANHPDEMSQAFKGWQQTYPNHPGQDLLAISEQTTEQVKRIALLLPTTGPLGKPADAIRDGIMAARFESRLPVSINIYDTSKAAPETLYQQAVDEGNQIVIGPLSKTNVNKILSVYDEKVPVLTLNYSDSSYKKNSLYEFGLSPIDEVQQVAAYSWQKGYRNAIVIAPEGSWGSFISNNFSDIWHSFGGNVIDHWYFDNKQNYNNQIKSLLHLNDSLARIQFAKQITQNNKLKATPRRRQDIDMIFVLAYPNEIRNILPLLRFYYANDVNIMTTSLGYVPGAPVRLNRDLNGVTFCDMPWVFNHDEASYYQLSKNWPEHYNQYIRLYALGYDAFKLSNVIPKLPLLPSYAMNGHTGYLRIDDSNHIRRQLQWAKVSHGKAQKL